MAARVATLASATRRLDRDGYMRVPSFCAADTLASLSEAAAAHVRASDPTPPQTRERAGTTTRVRRSETLSLLFGIHRLPAYRSLLESPALVDLTRCLLGDDVDCFLSVFRERAPGNIGEGWHQDGFWYPSTTGNTLVAWLALSDVIAARGALKVVPGSHAWGLLPHQPDIREGSGRGWMHIPHPHGDPARIELRAGDLVLMQDALVHASDPNASALPAREALFCFVTAGTTVDSEGIDAVTDRMPWLRGGKARRGRAPRH